MRETLALPIVALIGVGVPLAHQGQDACLLVGLESLDGVRHACLVGSGNDGAQPRLLKDGSEDAEESNLRGIVEVAAFLRAVLIPVVCGRLVEGFQRLELDAVLLFVVLADVHKIMRKLLVVFGLEIVLATIFIASHATAVGHVVGARVAEGLEDGIGPLFLDFEHYPALCRVALPMILVAREVLKALHLGAQSLAFAHVMKLAIAVLGVVASADVIAEMGVVETFGTDEPRDDFVHLLLVPFAALPCPPAKRHAPAVPMLRDLLGVDGVADSFHGRGHQAPCQQYNNALSPHIIAFVLQSYKIILHSSFFILHFFISLHQIINSKH